MYHRLAPSRCAIDICLNDGHKDTDGLWASAAEPRKLHVLPSQSGHVSKRLHVPRARHPPRLNSRAGYCTRRKKQAVQMDFRKLRKVSPSSESALRGKGRGMSRSCWLPLCSCLWETPPSEGGGPVCALAALDHLAGFISPSASEHSHFSGLLLPLTSLRSTFLNSTLLVELEGRRCVYTCIGVHLCVSVCECVFMYAWICMHVCMCEHVRVYM